MAQTYDGGFLVVNAPGFTASTTGTSASSAIPVDSSGNRPNFIRVAAINESYVKLGNSAGVTATNADILIQPADATILQIGRGVTHIAYIQGGAAGRVNVIPLENS
jgi:hypothetical protein